MSLSIYGNMTHSMQATTGPEYEARLVRAREIVSRPEEIEKLDENEWSIPSQSGFGRYRVHFETDRWSCGCKDFSARNGEPCKHILSVGELISPTKGPSRTPRNRYPQNEAAFDAGQTKEMRLVDSLLRDLTNDVYDFQIPESAPGRRPVALGDAVYCAVLKVYSGLSARRASGVWQNVRDRGLLEDTPSYRAASRLLNRPEVTPILYRLLSLSALPLAGLEDGGVVAPDSTGIQTTSFGAWREEKHGEKRSRKWMKVHAMVGTKTHVIIHAVVSETNTNDAAQFASLLNGTVEDGFHPSVVVADKGYLSHANYSLAADLGLGAYIPFKSNSVSRQRFQSSASAWRKAFHLFQANRDEFDKNYHRRSNVESVFSALKRKFGENIRSRTPVAQVNEVLCKLIAYNLTVVVHEMFENGIAPSFVNQEPRV